MKLFQIVVLIIFGYALHQVRQVTENIDGGFQNIADHAVGGVGILIAWPVAGRYALELSWDVVQKVELALIIILFGIGGGSCLGWAHDTLKLYGPKIWPRNEIVISRD